MKRTIVATVFPALLACSSAWADHSAQEILEASGVQGGLIVHLGCGEGERTTALFRAADDAFVVQGLDADAANVERAGFGELRDNDDILDLIAAQLPNNDA